MIPLASGLTVLEARAFEQSVISAYSLSKLDNARREISKGNVIGFRKNINGIINLYKGLKEDEILNLMEG